MKRHWTLSPESVQNIRNSKNSGRFKKGHPLLGGMKGKKHTEESKLKLAIAHTKDVNSHYLLRKKAPKKSESCDICLIPEQDLKIGLQFDHCHKTLRFRGWLCLHCNSALGYAKDNKELLKRMIIYLEKNND